MQILEREKSRGIVPFIVVNKSWVGTYLGRNKHDYFSENRHWLGPLVRFGAVIGRVWPSCLSTVLKLLCQQFSVYWTPQECYGSIFLHFHLKSKRGAMEQAPGWSTGGSSQPLTSPEVWVSWPKDELLYLYCSVQQNICRNTLAVVIFLVEVRLKSVELKLKLGKGNIQLHTHTQINHTHTESYCPSGPFHCVCLISACYSTVFFHWPCDPLLQKKK